MGRAIISSHLPAGSENLSPWPPQESARLAALHSYHVLDTDEEAEFDDLVQLAAQICQAPIALLSLVDAQRQWFKARVGLALSQTPRAVAFCAHAISQPNQLLQVPDASIDARFSANPLVTGDPHIRFYAGMPLVTPDGLALGALCVIDRSPRNLTPAQQQALGQLSRQAMALMNLRRGLRQQQTDALHAPQRAARQPGAGPIGVPSPFHAVLSQCSRAIVRCSTPQELFQQICLHAVQSGGMKLAWIGLVGAQSQRIDMVASFGLGERQNFNHLAMGPGLNGLNLGAPSGRVVLQGKAVWFPDDAMDRTSECPAASNLGASASLPLIRSSEVVGVLNLVSEDIAAFDDSARALLLELIDDIGLKLTSFDEDRAKAAVEDALRLTRISIETASDALFWMKPDGSIVDVNDAACRSTGYSRDELLAMRIQQVNSGGDDAVWRSHFDQLRASGSLTFETRHRTRDGRHFPVEVVANYVKFGDEERNCSFVRDVSQNREREARIKQLAQFDVLTGLPNRVLLNDRVVQALSMALRCQTPLAVLLLDIDNFKHVNDTLGHSSGDALLVETARRLTQVVREEDTLARLGGDEFLMLLPGSDASAAAHVAEKLNQILSRPCQVGQTELVVTMSIGIAMYPADGQDFESLCRYADIAMYRAKQAGRHQFCFYTAEMQAISARALLLENALRKALAKSQMHLHFQPQMSLDDGRIIGVEALLRWQHPELGSVSPAEFIPVAESSGQIVTIGEWVLREALGQLRRWIDGGLAPVTMVVNLSAVQFRHPNLPDLVDRVLAETRVPASLLELELTESVSMDRPAQAIAIMDQLRARGVSLAIDDFGTGYSSLSHLKRFKVNMLKIDRSFVSDIASDADDRAIVVAIIAMAKSLGIATVAEGVETPEQLEFLHRNGCDHLQGYHFSRPLPAPQALAFMQAHKGGKCLKNLLGH